MWHLNCVNIWIFKSRNCCVHAFSVPLHNGNCEWLSAIITCYVNNKKYEKNDNIMFNFPKKYLIEGNCQSLNKFALITLASP